MSRMKSHRHGYGERAAATLVEKMLSATIYCHHHGVVHRDIKLDNFIYESEAEDAELKLIDFGFAAEIAPGKESMWDQLGTPSYMAPELWGQEEAEYDSSVDMWCARRPAHIHRSITGLSPPPPCLATARSLACAGEAVTRQRHSRPAPASASGRQRTRMAASARVQPLAHAYSR